MRRKKLDISKDALNILIDYSSKGNIRELENIIERMVILSTEELIDKKDLPREILSKDNLEYKFNLAPEGVNLEEIEKNFIM